MGWSLSVQDASHCRCFYSGVGGGGGWTLDGCYMTGCSAGAGGQLHWKKMLTGNQCCLLSDFFDCALLPNCSDLYLAIRPFLDFKG